MRKTKVRQLIVEHASEPIDMQELMGICGYKTTASLNNVIYLMRKSGHDIWSINAGIKQWLVWYRGGPELKEDHTETEVALLGNNCGDTYTQKELSELMNISIPHVADLFRRMRKKGHKIASCRNERNEMEYWLHERV